VSDAWGGGAPPSTHRGSLHPVVMGLRTTVVGGVALILASTASLPAAARHSGVPRPVIRSAGVRITVDAGARTGGVSSQLLGVNHFFNGNGYGSWDPATDQPDPTLVADMRRAGVTLVRYPGGTPANLFRWDKAIGSSRGCQVDGRTGRRIQPAAGGQAYGPDEHMELANAAGAGAVLMVQSITETPARAADWVEYMNSPANAPGNPNGGVDWADRRASNGHLEPYNVHWWEIGNEQRVPSERYWMARKRSVRLRQYIDGGHKDIVGEALGKKCDHPSRGVLSDGSASQVFEMLYPPVVPARTTVKVDGNTWTAVQDFSMSGPMDHVYVLDPTSGHVAFGDGLHGAIPTAGSTVTADYRSQHQGVFAFIDAMKAVDPRIEVCPSWGASDFIQAAGNRRYSCFTAHSYTNFLGEGHGHWSSPLEGHDWAMLGTGTERRFIARLKSQLPSGTTLPISEFGELFGDSATWPDWMDSMSTALYMASQWVAWLKLGVPWSTGNDLVVYNNRGLFGPAPVFTYTPTAVARQALSPMFGHSRSRLRSSVTNNPIRQPHGSSDGYSALEVCATRARNGDAFLMVVNRMPLSRQHVNATVSLEHFTTSGQATVTAVTSPSFRSTNDAGLPPEVTLSTSSRVVGLHGLTYDFPAHSITVLRISRG
jgi:hypothetical protein